MLLLDFHERRLKFAPRHQITSIMVKLHHVVLSLKTGNNVIDICIAANMITHQAFVIVVEMFQYGGTQDEWGARITKQHGLEAVGHQLVVWVVGVT